MRQLVTRYPHTSLLLILVVGILLVQQWWSSVSSFALNLELVEAGRSDFSSPSSHWMDVAERYAPSVFRLLLTQASLAERRGDLITARQSLERALFQLTKPSNSDYVLMRLGNICYLSQDWECAEQSWTRSGEVAALVMRARAAKWARDWEQALHLFRAAFHVEPLSGVVIDEYVDFLLVYTENLRGQGRSQYAIELLEEPLRDTSSLSLLMQLGWTQIATRDFASARDSFIHGRDLYPDDPRPYYWLGYLEFFVEQDKETAEWYYLEAVAKDPRHIDSLIYLGHIARGRKNFDQAEQWYTAAEKILPNNHSILEYQGYVALDRGDFQEARTLFLRSLALKPDKHWLVERIAALDLLIDLLDKPETNP